VTALKTLRASTLERLKNQNMDSPASFDTVKT
jgi:hypothetical protein